MREVIQQNNLTHDDLLHKMKLKLWSDDLDLASFSENMRKLDPSLNNNQLMNMFKNMREHNNKIAVKTLLRNLTGYEFQTYDYRNRIFKEIYKELSDNR
jgi:hypothetical protein